ncbi:hypothetical protein SORBI_3010G168301 [Sorghum bicolor]|uniref:Uncharacterized protein n=1 Tax=Sorghum bicolor TaxID=4558 RepID=A0A1W0VTG1_SORBI|nr:hypothetical protein SORBI_3010G168301 [Sorghum bicolor]
MGSRRDPGLFPAREAHAAIFHRPTRNLSRLETPGDIPRLASTHVHVVFSAAAAPRLLLRRRPLRSALGWTSSPSPSLCGTSTSISADPGAADGRIFISTPPIPSPRTGGKLTDKSFVREVRRSCFNFTCATKGQEG